MYILDETVYTPEKQLAVDESLMMWKDRLLFRQYIPMKRARFGIKFFCLCEKVTHTVFAYTLGRIILQLHMISFYLKKYAGLRKRKKSPYT